MHDIAAFDVNTKHVGVAVGGPAHAGPFLYTWDLFGCSSEDDLVRSAASLYATVSQYCRTVWHPRFVYYEAPFNPFASGQTSNQATSGLRSLATVAAAAAVNANAVARPAHVQSWRKVFLGHGRPPNPKEATMARCFELGWEPKNDDEADAAGVWFYAMSRHFPAWAPRSTPMFKGAA